MSSPVWMVTKREFRTRMLTKSNIISLSIMLAMYLANAPRLTGLYLVFLCGFCLLRPIG